MTLDRRDLAAATVLVGALVAIIGACLVAVPFGIMVAGVLVVVAGIRSA
jgi:ABC-type phosphate transport system permease subunit